MDAFDLGRIQRKRAESGRATATAGSGECPVAAGTILYVPAHIEHRFHSITEDPTLLVFFAPAETANRS